MKIKKHRRGVEWTDIPRFLGTIVPPQARTQLYYADVVTLGGTVLGSLSWYAFGVNDLQDPDITAAGHQPRFHDEWSVFFAKYLVIRSHIKCFFWNTNSDVTSEDLIGLGIQHYGMNQNSNMTVCLEDPQYGKHTAILNGNALNPKNSYQLETHWDVLKESDATGMAYVDLIETGWAAAYNASPAYRPQYHPYHVPANGVVNAAVLIRVQIVFDVIYYQPIQIGGS